MTPVSDRDIDSQQNPDLDRTRVPVGAVVTLAAGGARMTVVSRSGSEARVAWLDDLGKPQELTVDVRALASIEVTAPDGGMVQ